MEMMIGAFLLWYICGSVNASANRSGHEQRLFRDITSGYNVISRPIRNASKPVKLKFGVALNQILDLDGKHQILSTYVWIYERWIDENLGWEPKEYNGLEKIMFPATHIWVPDIYIFNVAGSALDGFINVTRSNVVVSHDGQIVWSVPLQIKTACPVDATYFPYDKQTCQIQFGSWIHDSSQIQLELSQSKLDLSHYSKSNEFELLSSAIERVTAAATCCPGSGDHKMVKVWLKIRRKTLYYDYIVISPTIDLCVLTLATFLLPCECGWKIAIGLTVFLTLYVLQLLIAENVPDTNSTPLISIFLLLVMSLNCISLITATMVMNIKRRAQHDPIPQVSPWLLYICENYLSKITCTSLLNWKRMAADPDESKKAEGRDDNHLDNIREEDEEFLQLKEVDPWEPDSHTNNISTPTTIARTKTAESSFSYISGHDISDTAQLLQPRLHTLTSTTSPLPTINSSYKPEEAVHCENHKNVNTNHENSSATEMLLDPVQSLDPEQSLAPVQSLQQVRKRPSYRRAISGGFSLPIVPRTITEPKVIMGRKSIFSGKNVKYQWYFVADVIDTTAFIIYVIVMFFGIVTVLVILPLYA